MEFKIGDFVHVITKGNFGKIVGIDKKHPKDILRYSVKNIGEKAAHKFYYGLYYTETELTLCTEAERQYLIMMYNL